MRLHGACIQTHNIAELVDFYKKIFRQEPEVDGGVDYRFYHAQLILFKLEDRRAPSTKHAALLYAVDDVDGEYHRLADLQLPIPSPPTDKPWGVRSFLIHDPDGNTVSLFTPLKR